MKCPVCEMDCVKSAKDLLATLPSLFLPCPDCSLRILDKRAPLPSLEYAQPCSCGKRFIDEVFAHMYVIMVDGGGPNQDRPADMPWDRRWCTPGMPWTARRSSRRNRLCCSRSG